MERESAERMQGDLRKLDNAVADAQARYADRGLTFRDLIAIQKLAADFQVQDWRMHMQLQDLGLLSYQTEPQDGA